MASSLEFTFGDAYTNQVILRLTGADGRPLYVSPHWPKEIAAAMRERTGPGSPPVAAEAPTNTPAALEAEPGYGRGRGFGMGRGGPPPAVAFSGPGEFFTARAGSTAWRLGILDTRDVRLVLGLNLNEVQGELDRVRDAFILSVPVALLLVGLAGWVIGGRALHPLNAIAETAERVTAHGLSQRIPESHQSPEVRRVVVVLNRMMDRLERSFQQATRFSADASHELKTPLAVMQGELELRLQAAPAGSAEQRLCGDLLEQVQRLKTITRSLLLLAQADAGQLKLARETVDLSRELDSLVEDARVLAGEKDLQFDIQIMPEIRVEADRALLRTALMNLVGNAIKYVDRAGRIRITLTARHEQVVLTVGNTGAGIPAEEQEKIFDRFHRVHREGEPATEGLGLGLSLAREIIRAHHGEVVLEESRPGWTSFRIELGPLQRDLAGRVAELARA
jgi:heavy metal sensor kinase